MKYVVALAYLLLLPEMMMLSGCGGEPEIHIQPGPKITELLKKQDEAADCNAKRQTFLSELDKCGGQSENIYNLELGEIGPEKIPAMYIRTRIFELDAENQAVDERRLSLLHQKKSGNSFSLGYDAENSAKPIVIVANCVHLKSGQELLTSGRDIFIVAPKIQIDGTIRTTPIASDDQPGQNGGSIFLAGIVVDFGEKSKLDMSGGNAGKITATQTRVIAEGPELDLIRQSLYKTYLQNPPKESLVAENPINSIEDAKLLLLSWYSIRFKFPYTDAGTIEQKIYTYDRVFGPAVPPPNDVFRKFIDDCHSNKVQQDQYQAIINNPPLMKKLQDAWQFAIHDFVTKREKDEREHKASPNGEVFFIEDRFTLDILHYTRTESLTREPPIYYMDRLKYEDLPGGLAGAAQIFTAEKSQRPTFQKNKGISSASDPFDSVKVATDKNFIELKQYDIRKVHFIARHQDGSDNTSLSRDGVYEEKKDPPTIINRSPFILMPKPEPPRIIPDPKKTSVAPLPAQALLGPQHDFFVEDPDVLERLVSIWQVKADTEIFHNLRTKLCSPKP